MQKPERSPIQFFGAMRLSPPLFRLCETFFRIFSKSSKDPPSIFWCFAPEWMLKKPKEPPFTFFGTMRLLKILIFHFWKILNFRNFSMSPKGRSFIFLIFCNKLDFQKAQRVTPSTILKTLRFLSLGYGADFGRSRLVTFGKLKWPHCS